MQWPSRRILTGCHAGLRERLRSRPISLDSKEFAFGSGRLGPPLRGERGLETQKRELGRGDGKYLGILSHAQSHEETAGAGSRERVVGRRREVHRRRALRNAVGVEGLLVV